MAKLVCFYNNKGGMGKSSLATPYALHTGYDYYYNDENVYLAKALLPPEKIKYLSKNMEMPTSGVFDLGGWTDRRLVHELIRIVDLFVIPLSFTGLMDYLPTIKIVKDFESQYGKKVLDKIVIVINKTEKENIGEVREALKADFPKLEIFVINKSKYVANLLHEKKNIFEYEKDRGLVEYGTRTIRGQYKILFDYLDSAVNTRQYIE